MFKRIYFVLLSLLVLLVFNACKTSKNAQTTTFVTQTEDGSPALLSFEKSAVSKSEFERVYAKNNGGPEAAASHTPEQLREYLDLYVNFKRKVFEAEAMGLDTTPAFKQEFSTYKKQLVQPYLSAKEVEEKLIKEAYDRSGYMVNASHILVMAGDDASPEDTLQAFNKIQNLRDSIANHGKDFGEMAGKYSEDPSAKDNQGNLGFFSAFDMVYAFESAAYTTEPGKVSNPIRTRFGYHLVKVHDKIKNEGTKRAAHIIVRVGDRYTAKTEEQAIQTIKEIHEKLKGGEDFAKLAEQYSDDPNSAGNGGDLGTGRLLPVMEDLKHKLSLNEYSEPFQTRFGWHVMTITEVETREAFEDARYGLKQKISRDSRAQLGREALINRIKNENSFSFKDAEFEEFKKGLDNTFPRGTWQPDSNMTELYNKVLFVLGKDGTSRSIQDFIDFYHSTRARRPRMAPASAANDIAKTFVEKELLAYEEEQLPKKNPDFRFLLQEYRDGILLFTLMEQKVWRKAVEDSAGLQKYYDEHKDEFFKQDILEVKEYRATEREVIDQVASWLEAGWSEIQIDSAARATGSSLSLRIIRQTLEKGKTEGVEDALFSQEIGHRTSIMEEENLFRIWEIEEKRPAGIQPFDKVKSECITRYQDYLEAEWLRELAEKYPVKIHEDIFSVLFK